jgi:hypothetical protein
MDKYPVKASTKKITDLMILVLYEEYNLLSNKTLAERTRKAELSQAIKKMEDIRITVILPEL